MDLKQFLELFNPLPANHYLLVTDKIDEVAFALDALLQEVGGELHIALYEETPSKLPSTLNAVKLQSIQNYAQPFRALPRDNDIVIFKDIKNLHKNFELLLKIAYTTLANNADIIIMQQNASMDVEATKRLLERYEFRAANAIDLIKGYDLVMARKMHMWGNGL